MRLLALCILVVLGCIGYAQAQQIFQNQQSWLDDNVDPEAALAMIEADSVSASSTLSASKVGSKGGLALPPIHTTHFAKDTAHLPHHEQIIAAHTSTPPTRELHPDQDAALMEMSATSTSSSQWVNPREHRSYTGHSMRRRMNERMNRHGSFGSRSAGAHHSRLLNYAVHYNTITGKVSPGALQQIQEETAQMNAAATATQHGPASLKEKIMMELEAEKGVKDPSALAASALEEENQPRRHVVTPFEGASNGRRPSPVLTLDRLHGRDHVRAARAPANELEAADAAFVETHAPQKRMSQRFPTFHPRAPNMAQLPASRRFSPMQLSFFPHDRHSFLQRSSTTSSSSRPQPLGRTPPVMMTHKPSDRAPAFAPAPAAPAVARARAHTQRVVAKKQVQEEQSLAEVEAEAETEADNSNENQAEAEAEAEAESEATSTAAEEPKFSLSELKSALSTLAPPSLVPMYNPMYNPMMMPMPVAYAPMPMSMPQQSLSFGSNPLLAAVEQLQQQQKAQKQENNNNAEEQWYYE